MTAPRFTAQGWEPISSAPKDGTRIRLGNERDASSMRLDSLCPTYGHFNGRSWDLSSYFIVPGGHYGLMSVEPTHWMPTPSPSVTREGGE